MIVRMSGSVVDVGEGHTILDRDGIGYEILICGHTAGELTALKGEQVTLHTIQYFESSGVGGNLIPRLVGFLHSVDRAFFSKFITVKGMGVRKAIKALIEPTGRVAAAIESSDAKMLSRLPGIGKRAADQIIAELKGKVTDFALSDSEGASNAAPPADGWASVQRDALEVMIALGERRADAQRWLERAMQLHPDENAADEWVRLAYKCKMQN